MIEVHGRVDQFGGFGCFRPAATHTSHAAERGRPALLKLAGNA